MKERELIDYAHPLISIESLLREIHDLCLARKYLEAEKKAKELQEKAIKLQYTLVLMEHGFR